MKTIKNFGLKIFVLIIIIVMAHSDAFSRIWGNGAGGGYDDGSGGEVLVCGGSLIEDYIQIGAGHYLEAYFPDRGIKAIYPNERCSLILRETKSPAGIVEPFFITNDGDIERALEDLDGFAQVYADAIDEIVLMPTP